MERSIIFKGSAWKVSGVKKKKSGNLQRPTQCITQKCIVVVGILF